MLSLGLTQPFINVEVQSERRSLDGYTSILWICVLLHLPAAITMAVVALRFKGTGGSQACAADGWKK